jgi:uncharacterized protein YneF (UPF0154 family)
VRLALAILVAMLAIGVGMLIGLWLGSMIVDDW